MSCRFILLTNNPRFKKHSNLHVDFREVSGKEIVTAGRDLIHQGWALQNHPLYGNFRPHQQPFRTLLLKKSGGGAAFDEYGLNLIESAMRVYTDCTNPLTPEKTPPQMYEDCSEIDEDLMKETLLKNNLIR